MDARTGYPVAGLPVRCEVPAAEGGGPENIAGVIYFVDHVFRVNGSRMGDGAWGCQSH